MLEKIKKQVYELLNSDNSGHNMDHINRVLDLSLKFAKDENANIEIVSLIALLHDVDDYKLFGSDNAKSLSNARLFMKNANINEEIQAQAISELQNFGYSNRLKGLSPETLEGKIVSDADMCDCIGVNGIIRIFTYSLKNNKPFFDKDIFPIDDMDASKYTRKCADSSVCHIFEKVLKLKKLMLTESGKKEIEKRHQITVDVLYQLFEEENAVEWKEYLDNYLKKHYTPVDAVIIGNCAYDVNTFLNRDGLSEKVVINTGGACLYSLIPASLYNKIGVVTRIGTDFDKDLLYSLNIDTSGIKIINGKSNRFVHTYLSEDGQKRTFEEDINPDCMIKIEDIPEAYLNAKYIHVCTNFPDIQLEFVKFIKKNSNAIVSIDTHEAYVDDPKVKEAFDLVDIAFIDKEYKNLHNCSAKTKIFKLGKEGCRFVSSKKEFLSPAPICDFVVDKTGAGDTVTGVFLALKSLGKTDEEALDTAVKVATESIKDYGVEHLLTKKKLYKQ